VDRVDGICCRTPAAIANSSLSITSNEVGKHSVKSDKQIPVSPHQRNQIQIQSVPRHPGLCLPTISLVHSTFSLSDYCPVLAFSPSHPPSSSFRKQSQPTSRRPLASRKSRLSPSYPIPHFAAAMSVRKSPPPAGPGFALTKRARVEDEDEEGNTMVMTVASSGEGQRKNALVRTVKRTSGLESPIVSLTGAHGVSSGSTEPSTRNPIPRSLAAPSDRPIPEPTAYSGPDFGRALC
jgi:hypothetical protein